MPELSDAEQRERIPSRSDVPTLYRPVAGYLMVKRLDDISKVGSIVLPDTRTISLDEGHVIEKGPACTKEFALGDCVFWSSAADWSMNIDGIRFVLVPESAVLMRIPREVLETEAAKRKAANP